MKKLEIVFIAIALFIVVSPGVLPSIYTILNLIPIALYYFLLKNGLPYLDKPIIKGTLLIAGISLVLYPVVMHLLWATGYYVMRSDDLASSVLTFYFTPLSAMAVALIPAIVQLFYINRLKK
jgi:hypothetical protein